MPRIKDFAREWYKIKWTPGPDPGPIPSHAFKNDGTLRISIPMIPLGGTPACDVSWTDANGNPCSIEVLPFHEVKGTLQADQIEVHFRASNGSKKPVRLAVSLRIENGQLKGMLGPPGAQDANTGTFIADANPPRPGEDERPKRPRPEALATT
jgi:hypothetical protein